MKQQTHYSIVGHYAPGKRCHSLGFFWHPDDKGKPKTLHWGSLSHAKKTLAHCRKKHSNIKFEIKRTITKTEILTN